MATTPQRNARARERAVELLPRLGGAVRHNSGVSGQTALIRRLGLTQVGLGARPEGKVWADALDHYTIAIRTSAPPT